jgi:hypothetical protein
MCATVRGVVGDPSVYVSTTPTVRMPDRSRFAPLDPVVAASVVVAAAPVGYLVGWLFVVHLVPRPTAVWLSTVVASVLALLVTAAQ